MTHNKSRFSESDAPCRLGLRATVEELEKRYLFSCSSGDTGSNETIESQLFRQLSPDGMFPGASLSIGFGDHQPAAATNETVVTGLSQGEDTAISVLPFDDGSYAVAWVGNHQGVYGVYIRGFDASGGPKGDPQLVNEFPFFSQSFSAPAVALVGTTESELSVLWQDQFGIVGQRLDCAFNPIGDQVVMVTNVSYEEPQLQAIARHDDGVVVSWADQIGQLFVQGFDASLNPTHSEIAMPVVPGYDSLFRLTSHPEADFVTSFYESGSRGSLQFVQQYLVDGSEVGNSLQLANDFDGSRPILVLADGRVASVRPILLSSNEMEVVLEIHAPTGEKLFERMVAGNASLEDLPQLVGLEHGGFAMSFVRGSQASQQLFVQQFNSDGEAIGEEVLMNTSRIQTPAKTLLAPLAGNGYTLQWTGFALNGIDSTIVTRPMHVGTTRLELDVDGIPNLDEVHHEIMLIGLPPEATLNHGMRDSDGVWRLGYDDLESLLVINNDPFEILDLTLILRDTRTLEEYGQLPGIIGTDSDDVINSQTGDHIFGGEGFDTLVVAGPSSNYTATATANGFQLLSFTTEVHPDVVEVEYVQFDDELVSVETLLNPPIVDPPPAPPIVEEHDPPPAPPVIEEQDPPLVAPVVEDPPVADPPPAVPQIEEQGLSTAPPVIIEVPPVENPPTPPPPIVESPPVEEDPAPVPPVVEDPPVVESQAGTTEEPVVIESPPQDEAGSTEPESPSGEPTGVADDFDDILNLLISGALPNAVPAESNLPIDQSAETETPVVGKNVQDDPAPVVPETAAGIASLRSVPLQIPLFFELGDGDELAATKPKRAEASIPPPQNKVRAEAVASPPVEVTQPPMPKVAVSPPVFAGKIDVLADSVASTDKRFSSEVIGMETVFNCDRLYELMEETAEDVGLSVQSQQLLVGTAVIFAAGFSLAHVVWALRATMVITKMMSALPVWGGFDPLPLLTSLGEAEDDETLIDIASAQMAH